MSLAYRLPNDPKDMASKTLDVNVTLPSMDFLNITSEV